MKSLQTTQKNYRQSNQTSSMQIIEKTPFSVRSAVYHLKKDDEVEFVLFPMIHVGTQKFYDDVYERLAKCDLIFAEGVQSKKVNLLTRSYKIIKKIKRLDLVIQTDALRLSDFSEKIVCTDMQGQDFDKDWSKLSWLTRVIIFLGIPIYVVYMLIFGSRELIAENLGMDDLPGRDEILYSEDFLEDFRGLLLKKRDDVLLSHINQLNENHNKPKVIGIVYGASHMRNIIRFLNEQNYRVVDSEWLMVFDM
jgi:hypothetical protein